MPFRQVLRAFATLACLCAAGAHAQTAAVYTYDRANRLESASGYDGGLRIVRDAVGNPLQGLTLSLEPFTVSPSWGSTATGARVLIRGGGALSGVSIAVQGLPLPAGSVSALDDRTLSVAMPPRPAGPVSITLARLADGASRTLPGAFTYIDPLAPASDSDGDGMSDAFELQFGFDPANPADGVLDSDGDGRTNAQEATAGTHPRGGHTRYLPEGATGTGVMFDHVLAIANPGDTMATVLLRFLRRENAPVTHVMAVLPRSRATVVTKSLPGLLAAEFSTVVESDRLVVVDRTMTWDGTGYGSHAETSLDAPALSWYMAEGATKADFDLYYLLQNPSLTQESRVRVTYLRPGGVAPIVAPDMVLPPNSRTNIHVDGVEGLADTDVSALIEVTDGVPILVERAMYSSGPRLYEAGHAAAAVTAPAVSWFLAEGATGPTFDEFILLANPTVSSTWVRVHYLLQGSAPCAKDYFLGAGERRTIWVNFEECPEGSGVFPYGSAELSATVTSLDAHVPIVVERAMWWPRSGWREGHVSAGTTATATRWGLADGEFGGSRSASTWILIANTSTWAGRARVTLLFEDGDTEAIEVDLPPSSRTTVGEFRFARASGRRFGALVESVATGGQPAPQIVVERAMYTDVGGEWWAAGTNVVATRLP